MSILLILLSPGPGCHKQGRAAGLARAGVDGREARPFRCAVAEWRWARKLHLPGTPYYVHEGRPIGVAAAAALIDAL